MELETNVHAFQAFEDSQYQSSFNLYNHFDCFEQRWPLKLWLTINFFHSGTLLINSCVEFWKRSWISRPISGKSFSLFADEGLKKQNLLYFRLNCVIVFTKSTHAMGALDLSRNVYKTQSLYSD